MLQKTRKTWGFKKIIVYKIPTGGGGGRGGKPYQQQRKQKNHKNKKKKKKKKKQQKNQQQQTNGKPSPIKTICKKFIIRLYRN